MLQPTRVPQAGQQTQINATDLFEAIGRLTWERDILAKKVVELQNEVRQLKEGNHEPGKGDES